MANSEEKVGAAAPLQSSPDVRHGPTALQPPRCVTPPEPPACTGHDEHWGALRLPRVPAAGLPALHVRVGAARGCTGGCGGPLLAGKEEGLADRAQAPACNLTQRITHAPARQPRLQVRLLPEDLLRGAPHLRGTPLHPGWQQGGAGLCVPAVCQVGRRGGKQDWCCLGLWACTGMDHGQGNTRKPYGNGDPAFWAASWAA